MVLQLVFNFVLGKEKLQPAFVAVINIPGLLHTDTDGSHNSWWFNFTLFTYSNYGLVSGVISVCNLNLRFLNKWLLNFSFSR